MGFCQRLIWNEWNFRLAACGGPPMKRKTKKYDMVKSMARGGVKRPTKNRMNEHQIHGNAFSSGIGMMISHPQERSRTIQ